MSRINRMALIAHQHLANGVGGIDWAGLPVVVTLLGVRDVEGLVRGLQLIRYYKKPT